MADQTELLAIQYMNQLPDNRRGEFQIAFMSQRKDRTTALLLSLFLGSFGVDRFFLGQTGLGIAKLLTGGGCGVWAVIDWFLIMGAADKYNQDALHRLTALYPVGMLPPPGMPGQGPGGYGPPPGYGGPPPGGYGPPPPPTGGYGR